MILSLVFFLTNQVKATEQTPLKKFSENDLKYVNLQLVWLHQFQFAGYYAAIEKGFYREAGFKVTISQGGPGRSPVSEVVSGRASYGVGRAEILLHRLHGKPIVVLAAIFQHSAVILLAKKESGIDNPQRMAGRRVMLLEGDDSAEYVAMFRKEGVSLDQINVIPSTYNIKDLIDDKIDVFNAYITNEPYFLKVRSIPGSIISPRTYGIDFYGDCLFTSEQELQEHPEQVKAFREASLRGWNYAMEHPEEIVDLILKKYSVKKSKDHLLFEADAIRKLILPSLVQIGHMNAGRWNHMADTYVELGMADPNYSLAGFIYNPNPIKSYAWMWWVLGGTIGLGLLFSLSSAVLLFFNRRLQKEVTERKKAEEALGKSEEKYRLLVENIPSVSWVISEHGQTTFISPAVERLYGFNQEEIYNSGNSLWFGRIHPDDIERVREAFMNMVNEGQKYDVDYRIQRKDEKWIWIHDTAIMAYEEDGIRYAYGLFSDITERKQAEEALRESEERLARSKKMESLGLLAGGVAHDLNNILSGIVSYPELMLMDLPENSKFRKPVEMMRNSGNRAVAIVQDLLTVARGVATYKEPLSLNILIKDCLNSPEFKNTEQSYPLIKVKTNLDKDLFNIHGSYVHIKKVVMNLVSNALEAIASRGKITLSTKNCYIDRPLRGYDDVNIGEYSVLSVSDNGSGIHSYDLERIFEPFYTKKIMGRRGTGLGLAVVWNIVQDHRGYIDVTSGQEGTTFDLYFPITREKMTGKDPSASMKDFKGSGETILIIDDEENQREISCKMLETLGYKTKAVTSGEEAIEYLKEHAVDLLVLDMIMDPGINGRETYEEILKIHPNQKAIIVSGFAETDDVREAQTLGAGQYIRKPLTLKTLGAAVKEELLK